MVSQDAAGNNRRVFAACRRWAARVRSGPFRLAGPSDQAAV